jgi:hypothetical protein
MPGKNFCLIIQNEGAKMLPEKSQGGAMKRLIPVFILFACMSAAAPSQLKEQPGPGPLPAQSMEVIINTFKLGNAGAPIDKTDFVLYSSGNDSRLEYYDGEGSGRKLTQVFIYKGKLVYNYLADDSKKKVDCMARAPLNTGKDVLANYAGVTGRRWEMVVKESKSPLLPQPNKFEIIKQGSEKWNGLDCEVHKIINHYVSDNDYSMVYVDSKGFVRREMKYKLVQGVGDGKPVLDTDTQTVKFEEGAAMPKDWLNLPEGFKATQCWMGPGDVVPAP